MDQQRQSVRMVFVLLVSAVFCGIATFLAIVLLIDRPSEAKSIPSDSSTEVLVAGTAIAINPDPDKIVILANQPGNSSELETEMTYVATPNFSPGEVVSRIAVEVEPTSTPIPSEIVIVDYLVQPGDSLFGITQKQNTSIELMAVYGISSVDLVAGEIISLPVANPVFCPAMHPYVVRENDTVFSIAHRFGTTTEAIAAVNSLDSSFTIRSAQVLCIP